MNLEKRKIIQDNLCQCCEREPETGVHALWECGAAQDVWAGSITCLQKLQTSQCDMMELFVWLFDRLSKSEIEVFIVQAWFIWNQRNTVLHGGKFKEPGWLNKQAMDYLEEFQNQRQQLSTSTPTPVKKKLEPPPHSVLKLNFDAAIFADQNCTGFGAIIRNEKGEVMATMSAKGPAVSNSDEAEVLACKKALEFSIDAGFKELIIEGDNAYIMKAVRSALSNRSSLGNIFDDVKCLMNGLRYVAVKCIGREGNRVAHDLARFAKNT